MLEAALVWKRTKQTTPKLEVNRIATYFFFLCHNALIIYFNSFWSYERRGDSPKCIILKGKGSLPCLIKCSLNVLCFLGRINHQAPCALHEMTSPKSCRSSVARGFLSPNGGVTLWWPVGRQNTPSAELRSWWEVWWGIRHTPRLAHTQTTSALHWRQWQPQTQLMSIWH